jgi:ribosome-associated toxin RatA of RatAB toxin-antitoxin module
MARQTLLLHSPVANVLAVLADVENYPSWMDGVREMKVANTDALGRAEQVVMSLEGMGFKDTLTLHYQWGDDHVSWDLLSATLVTKLHGMFNLQSESGGTLVDYELDADVNVALPNFMKQAGIANIVKATMQNLKARCEQ